MQLQKSLLLVLKLGQRCKRWEEGAIRHMVLASLLAYRATLVTREHTTQDTVDRDGVLLEDGQQQSQQFRVLVTQLAGE